MSSVAFSRNAPGRGLLILARPHTSLWDGPRVAWWLSRAGGIRGAVFPVDPDYARHPFWSRLLRQYGRMVGGHRMVPMDAQSPFGLRHLARCLEHGQTVVLFPQGTGLREAARPDRPGARWLVDRVRPQVLSLTISTQGIAVDRSLEVCFG